jgi:hypothetical protein
MIEAAVFQIDDDDVTHPLKPGRVCRRGLCRHNKERKKGDVEKRPHERPPTRQVIFPMNAPELAAMQSVC